MARLPRVTRDQVPEQFRAAMHQAADMVADPPRRCAARNGERNYRRAGEAVGVQVGGSGVRFPGGR